MSAMTWIGKIKGFQTEPSTFVSNNPPKRRRILNALCLNIRLENVNLVATYNKPFDLLAEGRRNGFNSGRVDSNHRLPAPKAGTLTRLSYAPRQQNL